MFHKFIAKISEKNVQHSENVLSILSKFLKFSWQFSDLKRLNA